MPLRKKKNKPEPQPVIDVEGFKNLLEQAGQAVPAKLGSASFRSDEEQKLCDFINEKKAKLISIQLVGNRFIVFYQQTLNSELRTQNSKLRTLNSKL